MTGSLQELFQPHLFLSMGKGLLLTFQMALTATVLSFALGTVIGVARYSRHPILGRLAAAYVEFVRNSPLVLLVLFFRFAGPFSKPVQNVTAALTLFTAAVLAEVVRGGLNAVDRGQWEAARSQGFTYWQTLRFVVLPQALRKMIPPMFSQFITLVKDTSYAWVVGVEEFTGKGMIILGKYSSTVQFFAIFAVIALVYYVVCHLLSRLARWMEQRMSWLSY